MNKPHKHAELIKAWADGKQIQCRINDAETWDDTSDPRWVPEFEYRIKPEPKPDFVCHARIDEYLDSKNAYADICFKQLAVFESDDDNIRLVFDGETGKLKHVQLLEQKS